MSNPPLFGRTAVVAGASRGIGLAVAEELQTAGAHVVRLARSLADAERERRTDIRCDLADGEAVAGMAQRVVGSHGAPDILVSSAGAFLVKPLAETTRRSSAPSSPGTWWGRSWCCARSSPRWRSGAAG